MRLKQDFFLVAVLLFFLSGALPGTVTGNEKKKIYTLQGSISEAMAKNWALKAKKEDIDQSVYIKNQARAEFLPKLSLSYGYTRQSEARTFRSTLMRDGGGGEIAISSRDNYVWRGTVRQPLFTGFGLISSYRLAKLGIDISKTELELEKLDLALRVKEAYFNILIADRGVEVASKEVVSLRSNVKVSRSFYKVGMIPINDLLKTEVELADAQQNLVSAKNAAKLTRADFNTVLASPVNEPVHVEDILAYKPERGDFETYAERALEARPEIRALDLSVLQTDQQIKIAKSKNYPEVFFTYNFVKEGDSPDVSGSPFHDKGRWEALATLSWTFWEWGKTHYSARQRESDRRELIQTRKAAEDRIRFEVKEALLVLDGAEKNIPTTQKAVEQGEENLRVSEERYKAQVSTITEVLDAQTLLTQARVNYYRALYSHHLAKARLERAIGTY